MPDSPRYWKTALEWAAGQSVHRSQDWTGYCQKFCRSSYAIPSGFGSAIAQWYGMPNYARHVGGSPSEAPVGSMLFSKGSSKYGHIMIAARPFADGTPAAWSTDAKRLGWPDKVSRAGVLAKWNHHYLGWGTNINGFDLRYREERQAQTHRYEALTDAIAALERSIDWVRRARDTAKKNGDGADVKRFSEELELLQAEKARLKRMYDSLRRL